MKCTQYRIYSQAAFKNARTMFFLGVGGAGINFWSCSKIFHEGCPRPDLTPPIVRRGWLNVPLLDGLLDLSNYVHMIRGIFLNTCNLTTIVWHSILLNRMLSLLSICSIWHGLHYLTVMGRNLDNTKKLTLVWIVWILWIVSVFSMNSARRNGVGTFSEQCCYDIGGTNFIA